MKREAVVLMILALISPIEFFAQELPLVTDKAGTFRFESRTDYTGYDCGYTRGEITANLQQLNDLVNEVRKNPVLADLKGFECIARIYNLNCREVGSYGIPAGISFGLCSYFRRKDGTVTNNTIEPPAWYININEAIPHWNSSYSQDSKRGYFTTPLRKKTVEPGIDIYDGEYFVVYDPSRPPYWIPVTVREAFAAARESAKNEKDEIAAQYLNDFLNKEWAEIPAEYRDKPAYFGGGISRVTYRHGCEGQDSIFPLIVKMNPDYWNRELPRTAIQLINFQAIQNKEYLRKLKEEYLQKNSISYQLKRFEESFGMSDVRNLTTLIGK